MKLKIGIPFNKISLTIYRASGLGEKLFYPQRA